MELDQIIPAIFLIAVLNFSSPRLLRSNSKSKQFFKKFSHLVYNCCKCCDSFKYNLQMKKINLAVTGCMGRMGQQIIKSAKKDKSFKLTALTESRKIKKN